MSQKPFVGPIFEGVEARITALPNNGFEKWTVPATSIPRISPQFLELERKAMNNPALFAQEFLCSFESPDATTVFDAAEVLAVFSDYDDDTNDALYIPPFPDDERAFQ